MKKNIIVVIIILITLICTSIIIKNKIDVSYIDFDVKNDIGNTNGNIANNGFSALQNDWIYCQGRYNLYAFNKQSGKKVYLTSKSGNNLNVIGNLIFFTRSSGLGGFASSDFYTFDLKENKTIKIEGIVTNKFIAYKDWIYYIDSTSTPVNCLYKAKYDGTDKIKLTDFSVEEFNIIDNTIYTSTNDIKILSLEGEIIRIINFENELKTLAKRNIVFINDEMYFIAGYQKNYSIAKLNINSLKYVQITDEPCSNFNIKDDWIYFVKEKEQNLYRIKLDGTSEQQIGNMIVDRRGINIIDDWIYYYQNDTLHRIKIDGSICEEI